MHFITAASSLLALALPFISASPLRIPHVVRWEDQGCRAVSFGDFAWTVTGFNFNATYAFSTPAHQNSWGFVTFDLINPALAADTRTAICHAQSNRPNDFFYQDTWYDCDLPASANGNSAAQFAFDRPSGKLQMKQAWRCDDTKTQISLHATGQTTLTLDCTEEDWKNPNWTVGSGELYSTRTITCKPVNATIKPSEMTAVA